MSYGSTGFIWESKELTLPETTTIVELDGQHPRPPHITVTSIGDDTTDDATGATYDPNINVFVSSVSKTSVTIEISGDPIGGFKVSMNAISSL